jgi:hypothetical protein
MKKIIIISFLTVAFFNMEAQIDVDKYLWEYPLQAQLPLNSEMVSELREHFQDIIDSGDLLFRPLPCRYHDQIFEHYFIYKEPGRILQTIAEAWPYLTSTQQEALRPMVVGLFNDPVHRPWTPGHLPEAAGKNREPYDAEVLWGEGSDYQRFVPTIHNVYAVWSYLYRTKDTLAVEPFYESIRSFYQQKVGTGSDRGNMYGTMSAHVGMARLAYVFGDSMTIQSVRNRLLTAMQNATDINEVDHIAAFGTAGWDAPYGEHYDERKDPFIYRGFIFLNMSPEIGRYIQDHVYDAVMERHQFGLNRFPLWWIRQAPYFSRWTGDEGIGFPSESFGMYIPVERWVSNASPQRLIGFMRSAPIGMADSYWLESLVKAIEAAGTDVWVDVRDTEFSTDFAMGLPKVLTSTITNITQTTATGGGNVTDDGGSNVNRRGIVWNTLGAPDLDNNIGSTEDGSGVGMFSSTIGDLQANTQYHIRAYASNESGTAYGNTVTFTTLRNTFNIQAGHSDGGVIEPAGLIEVFEGDAVLFLIIPNDNYEISQVLVDAQEIGALAEYEFQNVSDHHEIFAEFTLISHTDELNQRDWKVQLFPNPSNAQITISIAGEPILQTALFEFLILDTKGQTVMNRKMEASDCVLDISSLPAGIYVLNVSDGASVYTTQFVIVR